MKNKFGGSRNRNSGDSQMREKRISFTIERKGVKSKFSSFSSGSKNDSRGGNRSEGRSSAFGVKNENRNRFSNGNKFGVRRDSRGGFGFGGAKRNRFSVGKRFSSNREADFSKYIQKAVLAEEEIYTPENTFADFKADKKLLDNLKKLNINTPTPIQDKSIPVGLQGKDILGIANTGTGKTLAFLLPVVTKIKSEKRKAIVLAPTRELASQIEKDFRSFTLGMMLWTHLVIGGANMSRQIKQARMKNDIVIGTPGRIQDLVKRGVLKLEDISLVVLDEADRMLDMGFRDDIENILSQCKVEGRQTFCFSATMSSEIESIANRYMNEPVKVSVKNKETSANVDQDIIKYHGLDDKIEKLHETLIRPDFSKTIIFCRTKSGTERLDKELKNRGFKSDFIHGDLRQGQRNRAIKDFKENISSILIATDVASRGLDIKDVTHVINYDVPENYEDYTHRIGRTGRAGKKGFAFTFVEAR